MALETLADASAASRSRIPDALMTPAESTPAPVRGPPERRSQATVAARLFSLAALGGVVSALAYVGTAGYHVLADSFVAPIILSPDNDLVIQSKLNLARVLSERQALAARIEQSHSGAEAARRAITRLEALRADGSRALDWSRAVSQKEAEVGAGTLAELDAQKAEVTRMTAAQEAYVSDLRKNVEAGLARRADLTREENALGELRVASLQNERDRLALELQQHTNALTQQALQPGIHRSGRIETPEMRAQRGELVRIEVEILKLENELSQKLVQERADRETIASADQLIAQMKARPIFRAIDSSQNIAFVPYTQLAGVHPGDDVYACEIWGVFGCRRVGRVAEVVPGEVATQDPWGTPARGQYALLALDDGQAAQAKTLRVRAHSSAAPGTVLGSSGPPVAVH